MDFVAMGSIRVINSTEVTLLTVDDDMTLEYDDTVILTFTPDDPDLISSLETAGEYIRDTATINIIDNDCKLRVILFILLINWCILQFLKYSLRNLTIQLLRVQI